jgi:hypothetical protein
MARPLPTLETTILSACAYGAAFGTLQVTVAQGVTGLPDLADARGHLCDHPGGHTAVRGHKHP